MTIKHTPGPWTANIDGQIQCRSINSYGNWIVATIGRDPTPEDHANTRLIAAAPDLLKALKHCAANLAHAKDRTPGMHDSYAEAETVARVAIAKAEKGDA